MRKIRVAGAALNQTPIAWDSNFENIKSAIHQSMEAGVGFLALPELCITGYGCEDIFLGNWIYETALKYLFKVIPLTTGITVSLGLPVLYDGKRYNGVAVISNTELLGITAKQFLANDGVHYESRWFQPWPKGVEQRIEIGGNHYPFGDIVYDADGIRIGIEVCEDAWQGENRPGVQHNLRGVHLIMVNNASHFSMGKTRLREDLVLLGSLEFHCAYVYVNLLGNEAGRMIYDGEILIAQHGELVQRNNRLSFLDVDLVWADVDLSVHAMIQTNNVTFDEKDRFNEFVKAASLALFDYLRKSRSKGFVISLSGGADSSLCAVLVSEMVKRGLNELGYKHFCQKLDYISLFNSELENAKFEDQRKSIVGQILVCAYQSTVNSSADTFQSASNLAASIGAGFHHWAIDASVENYTSIMEDVLGRTLSWETDDLAFQNIQARSRSPIIWMLANLKNALLITTSNRSEADVGYATMDGDTSGSIAPIAGVDKHFVKEWLVWAQTELNYPALHLVNGLSPSAELRPPDQKQTDEADLMPYFILKEIEKEAIFNRLSPMDVYRKLYFKEFEPASQLAAHIVKFFTLWARNQWKRERYAPAFHLDDFNVDPRSWCRFPILSGGFELELKELKKM